MIIIMYLIRLPCFSSWLGGCLWSCPAWLCSARASTAARSARTSRTTTPRSGASTCTSSVSRDYLHLLSAVHLFYALISSIYRERHASECQDREHHWHDRVTNFVDCCFPSMAVYHWLLDKLNFYQHFYTDVGSLYRLYTWFWCWVGGSYFQCSVNVESLSFHHCRQMLVVVRWFMIQIQSGGWWYHTDREDTLHCRLKIRADKQIFPIFPISELIPAARLSALQGLTLTNLKILYFNFQIAQQIRNCK